MSEDAASVISSARTNVGLLMLAISFIRAIARLIQRLRERTEKLEDIETQVDPFTSFFERNANVQNDYWMGQFKLKLALVLKDAEILRKWNTVDYLSKAEDKLASTHKLLTQLQVFVDVWPQYNQSSIHPTNEPVQEVREETDRSVNDEEGLPVQEPNENNPTNI